MNAAKIVVILGQTAAGKSELAIKLAGKIGGEVVSADSRQVYKGLDIGTGKVVPAEMKGVPHHLIDIVSPKRRFTVAQYKERADRKIKEIIARGRTPIICGGTGLYIDAVTRGLVLPDVAPNPGLRKKLEGKSPAELLKILRKLDRRRANTIDGKNKVRLIRAIEIAKAIGRVPTLRERKPNYLFVKIGLYMPQEKLKNKVEQRVRRMFKRGLLREIEELKKSGVPLRRLKELGFEYDSPTPEKVIKETLKYAKRQITWFKRNEDVIWHDISRDSQASILTSIEKLI